MSQEEEIIREVVLCCRVSLNKQTYNVPSGSCGILLQNHVVLYRNNLDRCHRWNISTRQQRWSSAARTKSIRDILPAFLWLSRAVHEDRRTRQWSNLKYPRTSTNIALAQLALPWIIARRITIIKKKKVISKTIRYNSSGSPFGDSSSSPMPPPARIPE